MSDQPEGTQPPPAGAEPTPPHGTPPAGSTPEPTTAAQPTAAQPAAAGAEPPPAGPQPAAAPQAGPQPAAAPSAARGEAFGRFARHRATQLVAVGLLGLVLGGGVVALLDRDGHGPRGHDRPGHSRFDDRPHGRDFRDFNR